MKILFSVALVVTVVTVTLGLSGCDSGSEEQGRIRFTSAQVVGIYELELDKQAERLELRSDGTYIQDTISKSRTFHHTGDWRVEHHFVGDAQIVLLNAAIVSPETPLDHEPQFGFGDLPMYVHSHNGKLALARNEVADWYYERVGAQ